MAIKPDKFAKIADSLRQYRRAQLLDFQAEVGKNPVELLYVDPLESDAILKTILLNNTTFLVGRKGTGKSTVFAKAQADLRLRSDTISAYIDVKSLHELIVTNEAPIQSIQDASISEPVYRAHFLRKTFLSSVIADLIKEIKKTYESRSLVEKWVGKARSYSVVISALEVIANDVKTAKLSQEEIPILRTISKKLTQGSKSKGSISSKAGGNIKSGIILEASTSGEVEVFDEKMADNELYEAYSVAVLRSFPFQDLLAQIRELLKGAGLVRLFVFFDDFSELTWVDQKLFVDVILSPLNNASDETIKLKVAGYPGRIYYGKIDPGKVDTVGLDFYQLYKSQDIQTGEASAINYLERLLRTRFEGFGQAIEDYFDYSVPMTEHFRLLFEITLNVPRLIGYVLHYCYLDRISKRQLITGGSLRLAALKYYETVISQYFEQNKSFRVGAFREKT